jgi:FkbM family methyltransferase
MLIKAALSPKYALYLLAHKYIRWYEGFSYNFEMNGEAVLLDALPKDSIRTIFDVGANVGSWTEIALSKYPNAAIYAFELSEDTFKTLARNLSDREKVTLVNEGLSNEIGQLSYKDYGVDSGVNTIIGSADFHDRNVTPKEQTANLNTGYRYCADNGIDSIDLLKIDVEGAEHLVLKGFAEMLANGKIKVIQFEYGYTHADAKFLIKDFYNLLQPLGYLLGPLKPTGVLFMDFDYGLNGFNSGPNYVAVHCSQIDLIQRLKGKCIQGFPQR